MMTEAKPLGFSSGHQLNTLLEELVELGVLQAGEQPSSAPLPQRWEQLQKAAQSKNSIPTHPPQPRSHLPPNGSTTTLNRHNGWGQEESIYTKKISINV